MKNYFLLLLTLFTLTACSTVQNVQYSALEKVGVHKRDILIDRIEKTSALQEQTKQEFKSAYAKLTTLLDASDNELEGNYKQLANSVADSERSAKKLENRIASVDEVATALFTEWEQELTQYSNQNLRQISASNLVKTKIRYAVIHQQMQNAYAKVEPVLQVLQDNTLYLKHNLNARVISGISSEVLSVEGKVAALIQQMELSIAESKQFIESMKSQQ